jgi:1-deoxy-D-xylulose-5-phosphate synthase
MLDTVIARVHDIVVVEENAIRGGFGSGIMEYCSRKGAAVKVHCMGLPDHFIEHGARGKLLEIAGLTADRIADTVGSLI